MSKLKMQIDRPSVRVKIVYYYKETLKNIICAYFFSPFTDSNTATTSYGTGKVFLALSLSY